jgi:hypothetical protein
MKASGERLGERIRRRDGRDDWVLSLLV